MDRAEQGGLFRAIEATGCAWSEPGKMLERILTAETLPGVIDLLNKLDLSKQKYSLVLKRYVRKRTNPQNNLMWKWHTEVAAHISAYTGRHWTAEEWHYRCFCPKFLNGEVVELPDGSKSWASETSSTQNTVDMVEVLTAYEAWCLGNDIDITYPEPEGF